jgi:hypothetical protein
MTIDVNFKDLLRFQNEILNNDFLGEYKQKLFDLIQKSQYDFDPDRIIRYYDDNSPIRNEKDSNYFYFKSFVFTRTKAEFTFIDHNSDKTEYVNSSVLLKLKYFEFNEKTIWKFFEEIAKFINNKLDNCLDFVEISLESFNILNVDIFLNDFEKNPYYYKLKLRK